MARSSNFHGRKFALTSTYVVPIAAHQNSEP